MSEKTDAQGCKLCSAQAPEDSESIWEKHRAVVVVASTVLFGLAFAVEYVTKNTLYGHAIFLGVILFSGRGIIEAALRSLVHGRLDVNFLMTVAAFGAFAIGQADEGAAVMYLFSLAEFLEDTASDRVRGSIAGLLKLSPSSAAVRVDGGEVEKHIHDVAVGDVAVVRPGQRIPVDGIVVRGSSSVNQALITGESLPIDKEEGSEVFAGSINEEGFLEVKTTRPSTETVISKVVGLVQQAQSERSPTESFVERFAKYYTPLVVAGAIAVALVPPIVLGASFITWFYRALILLVVSCPCALTISTPVSMASALTSASRNGVLVKGGRYLESLAKVRTFVFDKTGTLTIGKPKVADLVSFSSSPNEVLQLAASLESMSEHPIAMAIVEKAKEEKLTILPVRKFSSIRGRGIEGTIGDREIMMGNQELFQKTPVKVLEKIQELQTQGKTTVLLGVGNEIVGLIALKDMAKKDAATAVEELKARGVQPAIISGDNQATTAALAREIGVDHYHAELLPDEKLEEIADLRKRYGTVAMVGDGVNDAPALAKANVGIAMGVLGSDVSIETADISLMRDELSKIPYILDLSRNTVRVIKQNITASILVKAAFALLAIPGLVTLALAVGVGDMGLSLAVILNAMRLGLVRAR